MKRRLLILTAVLSVFVACTDELGYENLSVAPENLRFAKNGEAFPYGYEKYYEDDKIFNCCGRARLPLV